MKKYIAELIGTFSLVFAGTGAIVIDQLYGGAVSHVGIAATFGLIVTAMVYSFGDVSGAHINPAVTLALGVSGNFERRAIVPYIISQLAGAFLASGVIKILFPASVNLGATLPAGSSMQSFILEMILTFILMMVIYKTPENEKTYKFAGLAIGGTVLLEAMFAGPVSGASMNPARSIAPAVISGNVTSLWIYILAPVAGAMLASLVQLILSKKESSGSVLSSESV